MKNKQVLIVSHSADNSSVDTVICFLHEAGAQAIRLNADQYPLTASLTSTIKNGKWGAKLHTAETCFDLSDLQAVWYRRSHGLGKGLQQMADPQFLPAVMGELKHTLMGMLEGLDCFQLERFSTCRRLDSKEEQLKKAAACGLLVPDTCISNNPAEVKAFIEARQGQVIAKMQSAFSIPRDGREQVVFTNDVSANNLSDPETLRMCPMVFQQKVQKKRELRVTIVGRTLFAFSIDSQRLENAQTDWRREGIALVNDWQPCQLPSYVQQNLLLLMESYGLNYAAIDLLQTPDDEYYFLELNIAGEYFWLDRLCHHAISKQIAQVLLDNAPRTPAR